MANGRQTQHFFPFIPKTNRNQFDFALAFPNRHGIVSVKVASHFIPQNPVH